MSPHVKKALFFPEDMSFQYKLWKISFLPLLINKIKYIFICNDFWKLALDLD